MISAKEYILIPISTKRFPTLPQSILKELWPKEDGSVSGSCSQMAPSLHDEDFACIRAKHGEPGSHTMILQVFLNPLCDFHGNIMSVYGSVSGGPK